MKQNGGSASRFSVSCTLILTQWFDTAEDGRMIQGFLEDSFCTTEAILLLDNFLCPCSRGYSSILTKRKRIIVLEMPTP